MSAPAIQYSYGPVPSRRLGKSLGINNIPAKSCPYACAYCQVGRTTNSRIDRRSFYEPEAIYQDVRDKLEGARKASERVDYLTFVPDGEPTLDVNLGKEIALLKGLGVPVGVITNGSLLWREDVREEIRGADWVSVKVDSVLKPVWRLINRPSRTLRLSTLLEGVRAFAHVFNGTLVTETMLVGGLNDGADCVRETVDFLRTLQPHRAYLGIPTRPPAQGWVRPPGEEELNRVYQVFADGMKDVELLIGYEGDAFALTSDIEKDLLSITSVHPMRREAIDACLSRAGSSWEIVDRLVARGDLAQVGYNGHVFYVRRFTTHKSAR